jgi:hypothetical protein
MERLDSHFSSPLCYLDLIQLYFLYAIVSRDRRVLIAVIAFEPRQSKTSNSHGCTTSRVKCKSAHQWNFPAWKNHVRLIITGLVPSSSLPSSAFFPFVVPHKSTYLLGIQAYIVLAKINNH